MNRIAKLIPFVLLFLLAMNCPVRGAEVGEPLPDFSVQTFDGKSFTRAGFAGKPLLLVFWNTWCVECQRDLPEINRLAREFGPRGLQILAINTGLNDTESKARNYWKKYGYGFPTGFDHNFEIGQAFKVRGVPTVFLVDAKGIVRYKHPLPPKDMEALFKQLTGK